MPTARPRSASRWAEESRNRLVNKKGRRNRAVASRQPNGRPRRSALARLPPRRSARASPPPMGENARASAQVGGACHTLSAGSTAQASRPAMAAISTACASAPSNSIASEQIGGRAGQRRHQHCPGQRPALGAGERRLRRKGPILRAPSQRAPGWPDSSPGQCRPRALHSLRGSPALGPSPDSPQAAVDNDALVIPALADGWFCPRWPSSKALINAPARSALLCQWSANRSREA